MSGRVISARPAQVRERERGVAMVLLALVLVSLLIFASLVVDLGGLFSERRRDQNAADAGALAGSAELVDFVPSTITTEVIAAVGGTLGINASTLDWDSCVDDNIADADLVDFAVNGMSCISTNGARSRIQVRLPEQTYQTFFGGIVGEDTFTHSAFAIAGLRRIGFGSILPYGIGFGAGQGDGHLCLKTGSAGHSEPPCTGAASGNFGFIDFANFGSDEVGTTLDCGNGNQRDRNINATAVGVDHRLDRFSVANSAIIDTADPCGNPSPAGLAPNSAYTMTGNTPQNFGYGIYSGESGFSDGGAARLQRVATGPALTGNSTANVGGQQIDNNPLWLFITPGLETSDVGVDVPESCEPGVFATSEGGMASTADADWAAIPNDVEAHLRAITVGGVLDRAAVMRKLLERCIAHYNGTGWTDHGAYTDDGSAGEPSVGCASASVACTGVVFGRDTTTETPNLYDIQLTPRFAYVPELTTSFPNGTAVVSIQTFHPIFVQRLLGGNCGGGTCTHDFEPGLTTYITPNSSSEGKAEGVTAFLLPRSSLPNNLGSEDAAFDLNRNVALGLLR